MLVSSQAVFAFQPKETAQYFNGPSVKQVTNATANFSLSPSVLSGLTDEERQGVYFQYYETQQVCAMTMVYPAPAGCTPNKTEVGKNDVTVTNLKPGTSYTVVYKRDNTIRCITTPCPENGFESLSVLFTTQTNGDVIKDAPSGTKKVISNLSIRSRGEQVVALQTILIQKGYLTGSATGYFGVLTLKAVKDFQRANNITPTGFVGPLTRATLMKTPINLPVSMGEEFEGTITAYSTACFADGECSITVDGKKVITTIGWSQQIVGKVTGIPTFGDIENKIGAHAKVHAKKVEGGYTLYGSSDYYVHVTSLQAKLLAGGTTTPPSQVLGNTWVWQETAYGNAILIPTNKNKFTITFGTDGKISGTTDCNSYFGSTTFGSDGFIQFGPLGMTKMACVNSQESTFINDLQTVTNYSINNTGILVLKKGSTTMYFERSVNAY